MFDDRLKNLRKEQGYTMKQMAKIFNIPYTTYVKYENNQREPNSEFLILVARYFNITCDFLLGITNKRRTLTDINDDDNLVISKYFLIDEHGKKIVDYVIDEEYKRANSENRLQIKMKYASCCASAGFGERLEDNYSDTIIVSDNKNNRKADIAIKISGDSMEPVYSDGDIVVVKKQNSIGIGQTGVFIINGNGFIKKLGKNRLISINEKYDDIILNENDDIRCYGLVLGKL